MIKKRIIIISFLDGFANSQKPLEIKKYLENKKHEVKLIDTQYFSRFSNDKNSLLFFLPSLEPLKFCLYLLEALQFLQNRYSFSLTKDLYFFILTEIIRLRGKIVLKIVKKINYDLLICESQYDSGIFINKLKKTTLYDCATPWADELYFGNNLSEKQYKKFKEWELKIFNNIDYLSFHWDSYAEYVKKYYNYKKNNLIKLNKGTVTQKYLAKYNKQNRIIYLGYLGGYWINLPLLSRLSQLYPIDVYGAPQPDKKYKLNYKGYINPKILSKYQFGLITITKDQLRANGFSAKHIDYISYGLPVFVPEWRENAKKIGGSILFNEENFLSKIRYYSQKNNWERIAQAAAKQSDALSWDKVLKPLDKVLEKV